MQKQEMPEAAAVADAVIGTSCSVCAVVVTDSKLVNSAFGRVCSDCAALADSHSGGGASGGSSSSSDSPLVHHTRHSVGDVSSPLGQWVSASVGSRGLGVTSQLLCDSSSGANRTISARRRVQHRVTLLLTQLRLSSQALRAAVLSLVEAVVGGRYGSGSSRWVELVCVACVYVAHRQHQTRTVAHSERQALLTSELSALIEMDERLVVKMAGRIQRQQVGSQTVPLTGAEYLPQLIDAVQWCDDANISELLSRRRSVQHQARRLLNIAHKLDLQHGPPSISQPIQPLVHVASVLLLRGCPH